MKTDENRKFRMLKYLMVALFSIVFLLGVFARGNIVKEKATQPENSTNCEKEWQVARVDDLTVYDGPEIETRRELGEKLRNDPDNFELHNEMGVVLAKDGIISEAMIHFFKAAELNPRNSAAYHNIGTVYEFMEEYDTAQFYIEKANRLDPENKETQKTLNRIEFVIEYRPEGKDKYEADLGKALTSMGKGNTDLDYADSILEGLVVENPKGMEALNALGVVKARKGSTDEAEIIFKKVIDEEPGYIFAYINLVTVYESKGNFSKAMEFLKKARNLADDKASISELDKRIGEFKNKHKDYFGNEP